MSKVAPHSSFLCFLVSFLRCLLLKYGLIWRMCLCVTIEDKKEMYFLLCLTFACLSFGLMARMPHNFPPILKLQTNLLIWPNQINFSQSCANVPIFVNLIDFCPIPIAKLSSTFIVKRMWKKWECPQAFGMWGHLTIKLDASLLSRWRWGQWQDLENLACNWIKKGYFSQ